MYTEDFDNSILSTPNSEEYSYLDALYTLIKSRCNNRLKEKEFLINDCPSQKDELLTEYAQKCFSNNCFGKDSTSKDTDYTNDKSSSEILKNYITKHSKKNLLQLKNNIILNNSKRVFKIKNMRQRRPTKKESILKYSKEPRINSHRLMQIMLSEYTFLYSGDLRYYNQDKGCFAELDRHNSKVLVYSKIPDKYKSHINPREISDALYLLKINPSIQISPESIPANEYYLNILDGVLDLKTSDVIGHNPDYGFLNCLNAHYKIRKHLKGSLFKDFLKTVTNKDDELERLLKQYTGYALSNFNNSKTSAILFGESNSGKSVYLKLLAFPCGEENVSNVELQKLSDERYTALLFGKLLNVCNELPDSQITDTGIFKSLVSETDKVSARKLYCQPFSFYNKAKLLFATNNLPEIKYKSNKDQNAFFNRLIIIPFMNSIPEEKQDKNLYKKLQSEADIMFSWAVEGLMEYIENGFKFSRCEISSNILQNYRNQINSVEMFIEDACTFEPTNHVFKKTLVEAYEAFCDKKDLKLPTPSDIKLLHDLLQEKFKIEYKKIHRGGENKYGYLGLFLNMNA